MSLTDYVKWDGDIGALAYCYPQKNIRKYAKILVTEAQEAVIIVNGERSQKFGCGTHNLDSPNVPILSSFYGIPYGGENPWVVQAWFVNKLTPMNIRWSTDSFSIYDESFGAAIPISAEGSYGITIVDAEKFIFQLALGYPAGGKNGVTVTANDFTSHLYGELMTHTKSVITRVMAANKISITAVSAHLNDLSNSIEASINDFFEGFGCRLLKLYVTSVGVDESTENGRKISESIMQQTAQKISGHTWQQSKMFETVDKAFGSGNGNGGGGGLLGAILAVNMMGGGSGNGMGGSVMSPHYNQPTCNPVNPNSTNPVAELQQKAVKNVYCSNCSKRFNSNMQFCPHCGDKYIPCPNCGSDNDAEALRCVNCGTSLSSQSMAVCGGCNNTIAVGLSFCPHCGRPATTEKKCPRCNTNVTGLSFCPGCGSPIR
ncbi:MAG: SPFH domain-containing protein [Rikenellaceae bacterium]